MESAEGARGCHREGVASKKMNDKLAWVTSTTWELAGSSDLVEAMITSYSLRDHLPCTTPSLTMDLLRALADGTKDFLNEKTEDKNSVDTIATNTSSEARGKRSILSTSSTASPSPKSAHRALCLATSGTARHSDMMTGVRYIIGPMMPRTLITLGSWPSPSPRARPS